MDRLHRLPGSRREHSGFEWTLFRQLPRLAGIGTVLLLLVAAACRLLPLTGTPAEVEKQLQTVDILAISLLVTHWSLVFTLAVVCIIVMLMKGHGYVADAYELQDADQPRQERSP